MTRKTLFLFGIGFLALIIITAGVFNTRHAAAAQDVVKIGLSAPLTGDWAEYGNDFKRSVTMVFDRANRMGGVHGRKIELVTSDSRGDPKESVLIAEKFVADPDIIAEIGDFSSSSCMAAAPIYEKANMTQLSPTSSHPDPFLMPTVMTRKKSWSGLRLKTANGCCISHDTPFPKN